VQPDGELTRVADLFVIGRQVFQMSHQVGLRNERPVICTDQTIIRNVSIQSYEVAMVVRFPSRCACIQYFLFFLR
jgi:hypothetical protein